VIKFSMPMENHADDSEKAKIKTGSRISIWRQFAFKKLKVRPWIEIFGRH